ncbi:hypothetical protein [Streptomyces sp. TRM72054]|uniref:hypothetical protein n=1 Tax=Streptomyces sp. TRM72054 TaxID=2870562 RepID=UPI0021AB5E7B|nr:hypothetical protein [Streptomyces sp. TRM72054]
MSTLTGTPATAAETTAATRRPRLRGMTWLVWRQHRAAFWTVLGATALLTTWILYQRGQMLDFLGDQGWPGKDIAEFDEKFEPYAAAFSPVTTALGVIPVLLGVFVGAPCSRATWSTGPQGSSRPSPAARCAGWPPSSV